MYIKRKIGDMVYFIRLSGVFKYKIPSTCSSFYNYFSLYLFSFAFFLVNIYFLGCSEIKNKKAENIKQEIGNNKFDSLNFLLVNAPHDTVRLRILDSLAYKEENDSVVAIYDERINSIANGILKSDGSERSILKDISKKYIALTLYRKGNLFSEDKDYGNSTKYHNQSIKLFEELIDSKDDVIAESCNNSISKVMNAIGWSYFHMGDYKNALEYFYKSLNRLLNETIASEKQRKIIALDLYSIGWVKYDIGDYSEALNSCNRSLSIYTQLGDLYGEIKALSCIATVYYKQGNYKEALKIYNRNLHICDSLNEKSYMTTSLSGLGGIYYNKGDYAKAMEYYTKGYKIEEELGDKSGMAGYLNNIALIYTSQGDNLRALENFKKNLEIYESLGEKSQVATSLNNIGWVYLKFGDYSNALEFDNKSLKIVTELNDKSGIAMTLSNIGDVYEAQGDIPRSLECYTKSLKIREEIGEKNKISWALASVGWIYYKQEEYSKALEYYNKSLNIFKELGDKEGISNSYTNIGAVYFEQAYELRNQDGNMDSVNLKIGRALEYYCYSLKICEELGNKSGIAESLNRIGDIYSEQADVLQKKGEKQDTIEYLMDSALICYHRSLNIFEETGTKSGIAQSLKNNGTIYLEKNEIKRALDFAERSYRLAKEIGNVELIGDGAKLLDEIYSKLGNYKLSRQYFGEHITMRDSINTEKNKKLTQSKYFQLQYEKKAGEDSIAHSKAMEIKNLELDRQKAESKKQKIVIGFVIFGLLLVLVFAGIILRSLRITRRQKNLIVGQKIEIEEKNEELNQQNEEINSQKEELQATNEQLEFVNRELEKLSIVASETDNAVVIANADGTIEWINDAFTKLYGYTFIEFTALYGNNIYKASNNANFVETVNKCISQREAVVYVTETPTKDGRKLFIQTTLTPILDNSANIHKLVAIDTDITQIKLAEQEINMQKEEITSQRDLVMKQKDELEKTITELRTTQKQLVESEKMASLGGLVAGVAHEINTPVGISITAASTLQGKTKEINEAYTTAKMKKSDLENYLQTALSSSDLIVNNLMRTGDLIQSFKQVSVDQVTERQREFNFRTYMEDVIRSLNPKIKHTQLKAEIICTQDIMMNSFPGPFAQIITNLVVNSTIHGFSEGQEGLLTLSAQADDKHLTFIYADNGKGMTPEVLKKVFDPFFTTDKQRGTGLGMHIIYNLVTQKLGGSIKAWSEPGKGVKFIIVVPLKI